MTRFFRISGIRISGLILVMLFVAGCGKQRDSNKNVIPDKSITSGNPLLPGYFSDADIIEFEGNYYIYTTIDPWGGYEIAVWESNDFRTWTLRRINWPTKNQCVSPTSNSGMVSAPSVVCDSTGKFYMYVTAGSEIWAGTSDHPLGPWYNLRDDQQPMIPNMPGSAIHNIGAECFIDDDGKAYLFWGSGWNWINGRCYAAELAGDMCSFVNKPVDITPPNYFEAPTMMKVSGRYYLLYSDGRCIDSTYMIRYAVSDHPLGKWEEGKYSPILTSVPGKGIIGPGQPSTFQFNGQFYILYHRIEQPEINFLLRQVCIDSLKFDSLGNILPIYPSDEGIAYFLPSSFNNPNLAAGRPVSASTELSSEYPAQAVNDSKYGTQWIAADSVDEVSITIDLGKKKKFMNIYTWFENPFGVYHYFIEYSNDSLQWKIFTEKLDNEDRGAPRIDSNPVKGRYIRITLHNDERAVLRPAIWEIRID